MTNSIDRLYASLLPPDHTSSYDSAAFWKGCLERRLMIQRCTECRRWVHFPRPACPGCWSELLAVEEVSGRGTLFTWVVERDGSIMAVVELEEQAGLRLPSTIAGATPDDLVVDAPVTLTWLGSDDLPLPTFLLAGSHRHG